MLKKELALLLVTSLICLIALIAVLILIPKKSIDNNWIIGTTQFDPELGWSTVPDIQMKLFNQAYIQHNSLGLRSGEIAPKKPHILVVGDSIVWGYGVSNNETVTYYLQGALPDFQLFNLGVPGYGIDQYYLYLKKYLPKTNPVIIVVVIFTGNDLQDTINDNAYGKSKPLFKWQNNQLELTHTPVSHYSCMNFLSSRWIFNKFSSLMPYLNSFCKTEQLDTEQQNKVIPALLEQINQLAQQHNAPLLFVLSPTYVDFTNKSSNLLYFEDLFKKSSYTYIDQYEELKKTNRSLKDAYFDPTIDGYHYTAWGNWYLAKTIFSKLPFNKIEH